MFTALNNKTHNVLLVLASVFFVVSSAQAQQRRHAPQTKQALTKRVLGSGVIRARAGKVSVTRAGLQLQRDLASRGQKALGKSTFGSRNRYHAKAVGFESGLLAARSANVTDSTTLRRVTKVFTSASETSGRTFARAFSRKGQKIESQEATYKKAMNAAGGVASAALVKLAYSLSGNRGRLNRTKKQAIKKQVSGMLSSVRVEDLAAIVARDLGLKSKSSGAAIVAHVRSMIPKDDWAYGDIAKMKVRAGGDRPLNGGQLSLLNAGIRLANATWKAGQVHRAAWEGNTSRITPSERGGVYNPYDVLKVKMYNDTYQSQLKATANKQLAQDKALARVVFEVFKDLKQLSL